MQDSSTIILTLNPSSTTTIEADFPHASKRMQELVDKFQPQNPVPVHQTTTEKNVLSKNIRHFEDLSSSEQKNVMERISGIDYKKSSDIMDFASSRSLTFATLSDEILSVQTRNPFENFSDPVFNVLSAIKSQNPKNILNTVSIDTTRTEWGVFSSIAEMISMQRAQKRMFRAIYNLDVLMRNIQGMQVDLKKQQLGLQKDISLFKNMSKKSTELFNELELDCIALEQMKKDIQSKLENSSGKKTVNISEVMGCNELDYAITLIDRKLETMRTIRIATLQSIMQLNMLISNDEFLCMKINEICELVIPLWKWQYTTTIGIIKQQEAVSLQKAIRGITSKVLTGNSEYLRDTMVSAQKEVSTTATAIDDLGMVQSYIDDTITMVAKVVCKAN